MLSLLLFAGALHVDLSELRALPLAGRRAGRARARRCRRWWSASAIWSLLPLVGLQLPLLLLPAVRRADLADRPDRGDGHPEVRAARPRARARDRRRVAVQRRRRRRAVRAAARLLASGAAPTVSQALLLLLQEAGGGVLFGLALGYVTFRLLQSIDNYQVEVLLTLAAVTGGYALASRAACLRPAGDGGRRPDDRQPRARARDVGHHAPPRRHVLGAASTRS